MHIFLHPHASQNLTFLASENHMFLASKRGKKKRKTYMRSSLVFFLFLLRLHSAPPFMASPVPLPSRRSGHVDECDALLQFSNSLTINTRVKSRSVCNQNGFNYSSRPKTTSWRNDTDCCKWDGITCDNVTGNVTAIKLMCSYLQGTLHSNSTLFSLRYIERLNLGGNNLSGHIPTSICQKSSLEVLYLSDNKLSGTIPPCLGNLRNLRYLYLSFNQIQGPLPRSLANCTKLELLAVSQNEITDTFPLWLKTLPLKSLQLGGNNFHGFIESNPLLFPFQHLEYLFIGPNNLSGRLPTDYFLWSNLRYITLSGNWFHGSMPIPPPTAKIYEIGDNMFTGNIPSMICNAMNLTLVDLSSNRLTGSIPQCLLNVGTGLEVLNLVMNKFQGTIPEIYATKTCSLKSVALRQNQLSGTLPRSLARCKSLEVLDLSENDLEDSFPSWLETLPTLYVLSLRSNNFHGPIDSPLVIHPFPKLHIFDISHNSFRGDIPTQYIINFEGMRIRDEGGGNLEYVTQYLYSMYSTSVIMKGVEQQLDAIQKSFTSIDISRNSFQGAIPEDMGKLRSLIGLNFSNNELTGPIPSSLGSLTDLEWLDLSSNDLTGLIPEVLGDLTYLAMLNLSNNQLTGPIPQGRQFNTFKSDSFSRNPGLCGPPLSRACGVNPAPSSTPTFQEDARLGSWIKWKAVPMGYGCGLALGISLGYIALQTGRPLWLMRMMENKIYSLQRRPRKTRGRSRGQ